jgi:hypothetical protein
MIAYCYFPCPIVSVVFLLFSIINTVFDGFATSPFDAMSSRMFFASSSSFSITTSSFWSVQFDSVLST